MSSDGVPIPRRTFASGLFGGHWNGVPFLRLWIRTGGLSLSPQPPDIPRVSPVHLPQRCLIARVDLAASRVLIAPWTWDVSGPELTVLLPAARGHAGSGLLWRDLTRNLKCAVAVIRWGAETPSHKLRQCARRTGCGHKGGHPASEPGVATASASCRFLRASRRSLNQSPALLFIPPKTRYL